MNETRNNIAHHWNTHNSKLTEAINVCNYNGKPNYAAIIASLTIQTLGITAANYAMLGIIQLVLTITSYVLQYNGSYKLCLSLLTWIRCEILMITLNVSYDMLSLR